MLCLGSPTMKTTAPWPARVGREPAPSACHCSGLVSRNRRSAGGARAGPAVPAPSPEASVSASSASAARSRSVSCRRGRARASRPRTRPAAQARVQAHHAAVVRVRLLLSSAAPALAKAIAGGQVLGGRPGSCAARPGREQCGPGVFERRAGVGLHQGVAQLQPAAFCASFVQQRTAESASAIQLALQRGTAQHQRGVLQTFKPRATRRRPEGTALPACPAASACPDLGAALPGREKQPLLTVL